MDKTEAKKTRKITIRLPVFLIEALKKKAEAQGLKYQTLMRIELMKLLQKKGRNP